jgi:DNA-binding winged helix-turn-helix (wHTH) protein
VALAASGLAVVFDELAHDCDRALADRREERDANARRWRIAGDAGERPRPRPLTPSGPVCYRASVEFRILGPLEVVDGNWTIEIAGAKPRALLIELLRSPGETVSDERLSAALWADRPPETAPQTLRVYVAQLRRALGADTIRRRSNGYAVVADRQQVDLARFEDLLAEARTAPPDAAAARLEEALSLWRGVPDAAAGDLTALRAQAVAALRGAGADGSMHKPA